MQKAAVQVFTWLPLLTESQKYYLDFCECLFPLVKESVTVNARLRVLTCRAAVDSSLGRESISTSTSLAVLAIRAAKSWAYSTGGTKTLHPYVNKSCISVTVSQQQKYMMEDIKQERSMWEESELQTTDVSIFSFFSCDTDSTTCQFQGIAAR